MPVINRTLCISRSVQRWAVVVLVAVAALLPTPAVLAAKHHHHKHQGDSTPHRNHHSAAHAAHLRRLAAQEKADWREHLRKLHSMPRAERMALKRHNRRARLRAELEAQEAADARLLDEAGADSGSTRPKHHHHHHAASLPEGMSASERSPLGASGRSAGRHSIAERRQGHHTADSTEPAPHQKGVAARKLHLARLAALQALASHEKRLRAAEQSNRTVAEVTTHAAPLTGHEIRLAAHNRRLAALEAAHDARLQAHNERLAAIEARHVALIESNPTNHAIRFWQTVEADVPVKVITVDLNDANVKVSAVMARNGNGTSESFYQMIGRANPNVAVTGTFFSLDNLNPVGDIVIDGSLVHFGGMGTALCVTPKNRADMVTCEWGRHHDWSPYDFVCACGPRLLHDGKVVLDPHAERFKDRHMLSPNSRIAVGITPGNKLVFAMTRQAIYLGRLAKVMQALGCAEAMNLDAGTSTGFYYNGVTLAKPGRKLTNMIVVYGRRDTYEHALGQLVSPAYRHVDRPVVHRPAEQLAAAPTPPTAASGAVVR